MFRFRKSTCGKRPANGHTARVRPQLHLQPLELREVPAIVAPPPVVTVPDHAGDTPATARAVSLPAFRQQTAADFLPNAADVDLYKVDLKKGDYLVADVDATGAAGLASTLTLLKGDGTTVLAQNRFGTEPENRLPGIDPSLGVYVQETGTYYLRLTTSAPTFSGQRSYNLNLERVALEESQPTLALAQGGAYHAWLNQAGDTLSVAGPSGYGFSLRGNWVETVHGSAVTYSARGTLHLKTSALPGEVPLQVAAGETLTVTTDAPGWVQLGELKSVGGHFGLSLGPVAAAIRDTFGLDVNGAGVLTGWTIKTGAQIKHDYQSYVQRDIAQLLDGVPYLVSGAKGRLKLHFGSVSLTTTDQASTVLIADPADPFLYVGYKSYAAAGSVHGRI